jgi:PAS domain S-box-containing protein
MRHRSRAGGEKQLTVPAGRPKKDFRAPAAPPPDYVNAYMTSVPSDSAGSPRPAAPAAELLLPAIIDSTDDAIISVNLAGIITSWNRSAERIFGYSAAEALGRPATLWSLPGRTGEEEVLLERIKRGDRIEHFETARKRRDGSIVDVAITCSPIRTSDGRIVGASKIARDITERKRLDRSGLLLAAIVSSSDDAIVSKDLNGIITSWNEGAERIFGYTAAEMIGEPVLKLVPKDRKDEEPRILQRLRRGERVDHFQTVRVRKNGEHFDVSLTISPVKDDTGKIVGASKIARDITDFKRATAEREQLLESERSARAQAEHANRMKDDFLATISHELRTPLNAIVGWTEVLKTASTPEEVTEAVTIIERNAHVQAQLIEDLLDLGRISSGKMTLNVEPVDIGAIVQDAIASVQHAADLKRISIRTVLQDPRGRMMGDVKRLRQVVWNLLTNAVKFTPNEGRIVITVSRINSHIDIAVADTGRGIPPDFLPHVFERFRQADASITRQHGGLGIGLALVKQLVEMHAGSVRANSAGAGQGATFTVSLPVSATQIEIPPPNPPPSPVAGDQDADLLGIKVLAVDDDNDSLEVIRRILTGHNAKVCTASSADQAIDMFATSTPDVILSDIGMPGQDGYELIRRIRQQPGGANVPAAALTALARAEDRMRALRAGFQTHVSKPVAAGELIAVVRSLASVHRSERSGESVG